MTGRRLTVLLIPWVVWMASGCGSEPAETPDHVSSVWTVEDSQPLRSSIRFVDVTKKAGVERYALTYATAAADFDNDGYPDLMISNYLEPPVLFHNQGNGTFRPVDEFSHHPQGKPLDICGVSWIDYDNDSFLDLYLVSGGIRGSGQVDQRTVNRLYRNCEGRHFELVSIDDALCNAKGRGRSAVPLSLNNDRQIDLVILNMKKSGPPHRFLVLDESMGPELTAETIEDSTIDGNHLFALHLDDSRERFLLSDRGRLYQRESGRLIDVSAEKGIPAISGISTCAVADYDNDGDLDIYMIRGAAQAKNQYVLDDQTIYFRFQDRPRGQDAGFCFRTDGQIEVMVYLKKPGQQLVSSRQLLRLGRNESPAAALPWRGTSDNSHLAGEPTILDDSPEGIRLWRQSAKDFNVCGQTHSSTGLIGVIRCSAPVEIRRSWGCSDRDREYANILLENRQGRFVDVTTEAGVGETGQGRDAIFADFDNDGDLDLYVINGGRVYGNSPNTFYLNNGNRTFSDVTQETETAGPKQGRGNSGVVLDYDQDGDLDLFFTNGHGSPIPASIGPYCLWRNDSDAGNYVRVELIGTSSPRMALGTRVIARTATMMLIKQRTAGTGFCSTSVLPLHFGIGDAESVELEVIWPSQQVTYHHAVAGEFLRLYEPERALPERFEAVSKSRN